jgi:hypothetical protein
MNCGQQKALDRALQRQLQRTSKLQERANDRFDLAQAKLRLDQIRRFERKAKRQRRSHSPMKSAPVWK